MSLLLLQLVLLHIFWLDLKSVLLITLSSLVLPLKSVQTKAIAQHCLFKNIFKHWNSWQMQIVDQLLNWLIQIKGRHNLLHQMLKKWSSLLFEQRSHKRVMNLLITTNISSEALAQWNNQPKKTRDLLLLRSLNRSYTQAFTSKSILHNLTLLYTCNGHVNTATIQVF